MFADMFRPTRQADVVVTDATRSGYMQTELHPCNTVRTSSAPLMAQSILA